jgi:hypothetical protein
MSLLTGFVQEKSALEELDKVQKQLAVLHALMENFIASEKEIKTILSSWTPLQPKNDQENKELLKIYSKGELETWLLHNYVQTLDALVLSSHAPQDGCGENSNYIKDIRLGYFNLNDD